MKIIHNKNLILLLCMAGCLCMVIANNANAQPAGVPYTSEKDQGAQALADAANKIKSPTPTAKDGTTEDSIKNVLTGKLEEAGIKMGWDTEKNRFANVAEYEFQTGADLEIEEYFIARQIASLGALVKGQVELAKWLGADAGMNVSINNPGDPFTSKHEKDLDNIQSQLQFAKAEAEKQGIRFNAAEESAFRGVTTWDRIKIAQDALLKKVSANYNPQAVLEAKDSRANQLKSQAEAARDQVAALEKEYEDYRQNFAKKSTQAGIELTFDHVIFGMSAICWAENLNRDGKIQVGMAYVWSPKLAQSAHAAMVGDSSLEPDNVKTEDDVDGWIKRQDLSTFGAFRNYVDKNGDRWFLGCGLVPNSVDEATTLAELCAIQNLYMPLYSTLQGKQISQLSAKSGKKGSSFAQGVYEDLQSFAKANTRGINQIATKDIQWPARILKQNTATTISVSAVVYSLNAKSAAAALKANVQMALAAAATERENNRRRLEQKQLNSLVENAKKETLPSRVPAFVNEANQSNNKGTAQPVPFQNKTQTNDPNAKYVPQPGLKVTPGKAKDDF
jgi:hypothetical protein